jgi:hypothetical protein
VRCLRCTQTGLDLIVNPSDFVNDANVTVKIVNSEVGIRPTLISSAEADVDLATAQEAGSARYPFAFASAAPQHGVGDTVLGGVLPLVSPADKPAGANIAVLTLTIVSRYVDARQFVASRSLTPMRRFSGNGSTRFVHLIVTRGQ